MHEKFNIFFIIMWLTYITTFACSLPHAEVQGYVNLYWKTLATPGQCKPAYIQLDHVYGLDGFDLNMSSILFQSPPTSASSSSSSSPLSSWSSSSSSSSSSASAVSDAETSSQSKCVIASNDAVTAPYASSCPASSSVALAVSNKSSVFHCMFPSKRPRFIVQR